MAELVYAYASGAYGAILESSNLSMPTHRTVASHQSGAWYGVNIPGHGVTATFTIRVREILGSNPSAPTKMNKKFTFSNSYLESVHGIDYLNLGEENHYKTGLAAGHLLVKSDCKVIKFIKNPLIKIILKFLYLKHKTRLETIKFPEDYRDELRGYSDATRIPYKYLHLINLIYEIRGCSSFAFFNPDESLLVGHNTDLSKLFTKFITYFFRPLVTTVKISGKNSFVHVSFPLFIGVVNGFNKKGIAITSHDIGNIYIKVVKNNISTSCFSRMILEKAGSLDEVFDIAQNNFVYLAVNTLVASNTERKLAILEMYPSDFNLTIAENRPYVFITNHYQSEKMKKYHQGVFKGSMNRLQCLEQFLSGKTNISIEDAINLLKDRRNGLKRDFAGHSVTNIGTFQSFIFDVTNGDIYISNGKKPPVSLHGNYIKISGYL